MAATNAYRRLFLQGLAWDAQDASATLFNTLKAASRAQLIETKSGKVLTGSAGNGFNGTWTLPNNGQGVTGEDIAELCSDLLDRYAAAVTALSGTPTDAQIVTEMLALMKKVTSSYNDFSGLRLQPGVVV